MNERNWYGLDYYPQDRGCVWADMDIESRPKAGLPAAKLFVFPSREARDAWMGEERPRRLTGRYHRDACDASTARAIMIDAIRLDRLTAGERISSGEWPVGELVGEYARIHPDRMIPDPTSAPSPVDPADPVNLSMTGADTSSMGVTL